jgi:hypothetical protein
LKDWFILLTTTKKKPNEKDIGQNQKSV